MLGGIRVEILMVIGLGDCGPTQNTPIRQRYRYFCAFLIRSPLFIFQLQNLPARLFYCEKPLTKNLGAECSQPASSRHVTPHYCSQSGRFKQGICGRNLSPASWPLMPFRHVSA